MFRILTVVGSFLSVLTAATLFGPYSWAMSIDPSCKAQPVQNELVKGRASTVSFPGGRKITVVGHLHGKRQIYDIMDLALSGKLASLSNEEFAAFISKILKENTAPSDTFLLNSNRRKAVAKLNELGINGAEYFNVDDGFDLQDVTVLNHARQDFQFLSGQLSNKAQALGFVGFEGAERTWFKNFPYYLRAYQELIKQFSARKEHGLSTAEGEVKDALLSASNGNTFAYIQDPSLGLRVPMFGVEDSNAGKKYQEADPLIEMQKRLKAVSDADKAYWDTRPKAQLEAAKKDLRNLRFGALLVQLYNEVADMDVTTLADLDKKIAILKQNTFPWVEKPLNDLFEAFKTRIRLNLDRDFNSAKNLTGLHGSGIHFVGLNHFRNIVRNLEQMCTVERSAPAFYGQDSIGK